MLVSSDRVRKQELPPGERKSIATDRVIVVHGPPDEVFWVREIHRMFTQEGKSFVEIADELEQRQVPFSSKEAMDRLFRKTDSDPPQVQRNGGLQPHVGKTGVEIKATPRIGMGSRTKRIRTDCDAGVIRRHSRSACGRSLGINRTSKC